jgi:hypothetical protein
MNPIRRESMIFAKSVREGTLSSRKSAAQIYQTGYREMSVIDDEELCC